MHLLGREFTAAVRALGSLQEDLFTAAEGTLFCLWLRFLREICFDKSVHREDDKEVEDAADDNKGEQDVDEFAVGKDRTVDLKSQILEVPAPEDDGDERGDPTLDK